MKCKEIVRKISEYIDGELGSSECESIREHIENCPTCRSFFSSFTRNIELCRELLKVEMPEEIKSRLRQRLEEEYKRCSDY
ncbi:zf-HC2 domain-containing protein [bacterium]|nr:zf-HC2 domain-containing protein [bacterium]